MSCHACCQFNLLLKLHILWQCKGVFYSPFLLLEGLRWTRSHIYIFYRKSFFNHFNFYFAMYTLLPQEHWIWLWVLALGRTPESIDSFKNKQKWCVNQGTSEFCGAMEATVGCPIVKGYWLPYPMLGPGNLNRAWTALCSVQFLHPYPPSLPPVQQETYVPLPLVSTQRRDPPPPVWHEHQHCSSPGRCDVL